MACLRYARKRGHEDFAERRAALGAERERAKRIDSLGATDWAYLAGVLDGEGCFSATAPGRGRRGGRALISLTNTDRGLVEWLHATFGGSFSHRESRNPREKPQWAWRLEERRWLPTVLAAVRPFLRVKGGQAVLLSDFLAVQGPTLYGAPPTDEQSAALTGLKQRLGELNRRGR
jgi:hypothetical protein